MNRSKRQKLSQPVPFQRLIAILCIEGSATLFAQHGRHMSTMVRMYVVQSLSTCFGSCRMRISWPRRNQHKNMWSMRFVHNVAYEYVHHSSNCIIASGQKHARLRFASAKMTGCNILATDAAESMFCTYVSHLTSPLPMHSRVGRGAAPTRCLRQKPGCRRHL